MTPEFSFFGVHVPKLFWVSYALFMSMAFIGGLLIALYQGRKRGLSSKTTFWLWLSCIAGGLIGARLWFMALWESRSFVDYLKAIFDFSQGGLASSGAFFGVFVTAFLFAKLRGENLWKHADLFGIAGGFIVAFCRFGCLFAGCCYGAVADLPWSVFYKDALRHPAQFYEIIAGLGILLFMLTIRNRKRWAGYFFMLFVALYSSLRFLIEFARDEPKIGLLTYSQYIYGTLFIIAVTIIYLKKRKVRLVSIGL